ncbi:MFS transporter [Bifidobacterium choloepi]|uniref:MFS transporter n=1 Tax=Bifidobacterium choloepi TaxID=2614131 RepID=A0A6I5NEK8_9BIFI|nr:MFS transporter [Bifidobacterium choloepi]NEG69784.1 MFS transporter [Bifidobacterium choloepi]
MTGTSTKATAAASGTSGKSGRPFWTSPAYIPWFTADTAAALGLSLRGLAISLIGYKLSGSTVLAGWLGTSASIAQQVFALFGGTFVDRHDRRLLIIVNGVAGALAWGAVAGLDFLGHLGFVTLLAIATVESGIAGFLGSASDAMLRSIIDIADYPTARSVNEGRDAAIGMGGSPLGGVLYAVGPWLPFLVAAVAYAAAGAAACFIRLPKKRRNLNDSSATDAALETLADPLVNDSLADDAGQSGDNPSTDESFIHDFVGGWKWTVRRRLIIVVIAAAALINFGVNGISYAITLHLVADGTGSAKIGLLDGSIAAAMFVGAFLAGKLARKLPVGRTVCAATVLVAALAVALTAVTAFWPTLVVYMFLGLPFPMFNAMLLGYIFAKAPTTMQGRLATTVSVPASMLSMFCSAAAGSLLAAVGYRWSIATFAATLVAAAIIMLASRRLRTIPAADRWDGTTLD